MRYFVDDQGRIMGQCVTGDNAINAEQYRILDLDLDPAKAQYYLYNPNGMLTLDILRYEPVQKKRLDKLYEASKDLVSPDRWERYTTPQKEAVSAYRAILRDFPNRTDWPDIPDSDWPVEPVVP